ncbi:M14 family zinc carboxypeptidase [Mesohalobacter halotolerans]|uniref:Peptidase M14 n=1 Tax=Mesohalobacter halotolerans TaxID=1883405 RepID=A0A4U5TQQ1_9FLAO|nr:M14 family zinc carboxypeptidase [Mesohalobacter halotolerans]MBS3737763.1 peptidase M14 [Psychroflexus sp.]TKS56540.1 peptidase M14 [Mesohalobacter halotolerans]
MDISSYKRLQQNYSSFEVSGFDNRYLSFEHLQTHLNKNVFPYYSHQSIGRSIQKRPIYEINIGHGNTKILIWSQMHGNESTTTKAILDLLNYCRLNAENAEVMDMLSQCTIKIIPMLNPDGATQYTRLNANSKDLNRDAIDQSQSETQAFFQVFKQFKPDYCFNMHGQRTMYSAGQAEYPATLSFLSPSVNANRSLNTVRKTAMQLILSAFETLQAFIPNQIGRYDDTYNANCFGDHIQSQGIPTVLVEAGHYPGDYNRNKTRQLVFMCLHKMLSLISQNGLSSIDYNKYSEIPMNHKLFFDCIITNALQTYPDAIGLTYSEVLEDDKIVFLPIIKIIDRLDDFFAFRYIDAQHQNILAGSRYQLKVGEQLDKIRVGKEIIDLKFS